MTIDPLMVVELKFLDKNTVFWVRGLAVASCFCVGGGGYVSFVLLLMGWTAKPAAFSGKCCSPPR